MGNDALSALVSSGKVSNATIDDSALRVLTPMFATGLFDVPNPNTIDNNVTSANHNGVARDLAARSIVLLKNEGPKLGNKSGGPKLGNKSGGPGSDHDQREPQPIAGSSSPGLRPLLPLSAKAGIKIALIGAQAQSPTVHGGGSGQVIPYYVSSPYDAIRDRLGLAPPPPAANNCSDGHFQEGIDFRNTVRPSRSVRLARLPRRAPPPPSNLTRQPSPHRPRPAPLPTPPPPKRAGFPDFLSGKGPGRMLRPLRQQEHDAQPLSCFAADATLPRACSMQ